MKRQSWAGKSFATFVLAPFCVLMAFPFVWMLLTSLREQNTIFNGPFFPRSVTGKAYQEAWTSIEFPLHFWNSVWITSVTVAGVLVFATLSGYAFAKLDFPFRNTLFVLLLTTLMMPSTALIIPLYLELKSLGLLDTQTGLLVLYISGSAPFAMFLMRAFFQTLPDELIEAARVDGAGLLRTFTRIILPISIPGFVVTIIWQFTSAWNDFLFAVFFSTANTGPVTLALNNLANGAQLQNYGASMAGALLASLPTLVVYIVLGKYFVGGLMSGSVKG